MGLAVKTYEYGERPPWLTPALEFSAGLVGGFFAKLAEYPLDMVKSLEQTRSGADAHPSVAADLRHSYDAMRLQANRGGWLSLYKGLPMPLFSVCVEASLLFTVHGRVKSWFQDGTHREISIWEHAIAGAAAGLVATPILSPVELVKIRVQCDTEGRYKNSWDCLRKCLNEYGHRFLTRGFTATLAREIPGSAAYFAFYELALKGMMSGGKTREELNPAQIMLAGGFGGAMYWLLPYPLDCAKSVIQNLPVESPHVGLRETLKTLYREGGWSRLYRGSVIGTVRAFPGNGTMFLGFETCMRFFREQGLLE